MPKWAQKMLLILLTLPVFVTFQQGPTADSQGNPWVVRGTMKHIDVEGGCWILETPNRERFVLYGDAALLKELQIEELPVVLLVDSAYNRVDRCMIGRHLWVLRILRKQEARSQFRGERHQLWKKTKDFPLV